MKGPKIAVLLGLAFSGMLLWWALREVDPEALLEAFKGVQFIPLSLAGLSLVIGILLRSVRWRLLGGAPAREQGRYSRSTSIGLFANFIMPARMGELVRVFVLKRLLALPLSAVAASAIADRLMDVVMLVILSILLYFILPVRELIDAWLAGFLIFLCLFGFGLLLTSKRNVLGRFVLNRLLTRWALWLGERPFMFIAGVRRSLSASLGRMLSPQIIGVLMAIMLFDYMAIYSMISGLGLDLPLSAPIVLWVFMSAGATLPSAPGFIGIYQVACLWGFSLFSVAPAMSMAFAMIYQILVLMVTGLMALTAVFYRSPLSSDSLFNRKRLI